jgi:hypothetical protein
MSSGAVPFFLKSSAAIFDDRSANQIPDISGAYYMDLMATINPALSATAQVWG